MRLCTPTSLREKVVKVGAKVIAHGPSLVFQMAEVAVRRKLFARLLDRNARYSAADVLDYLTSSAVSVPAAP